jgi:hypothetical protein
MQSKITPNDVKKLIDLNSHIINFGSPDNAPVNTPNLVHNSRRKLSSLF